MVITAMAISFCFIDTGLQCLRIYRYRSIYMGRAGTLHGQAPLSKILKKFEATCMHRNLLLFGITLGGD